MNKTIPQFRKKKSSKQDKAYIYNPLYNRFNQSINFLKILNKIIPESLIDYQKLNFKKEEIQKLDKKELEELKIIYKSLIEFAQNPVTRSIQIKSPQVGGMLIGKFRNALYASMINEFIREMSLVYLITEFEQYISEVLKITFQIKPVVMKSSKKQISYENLFSFKNFDDLKENIIEQEVSSIINQDINEVNKHLKKHFNLDLSKSNNWRKFTEYFYHRNILIHNNGYPNKIYRTKTGYKGEQKKLAISKHYLASGIKLFQEYSKIIRDVFIKKFTTT